MIYLLVYLVDGEAQVFKNQGDFEFYVSHHITVSDDREDYCYFILPDDFCIPVKHLHHSVMVMDILASMGYDSLNLRREGDDGDE